MDNFRKMKGLDMDKRMIVGCLLVALGVLPLRAQESTVENVGTHTTTWEMTYCWGITGYASAHGISAWNANGKEGGMANSLRIMYSSPINRMCYGMLAYNNQHTQRFRAEEMGEKVNLTYVAPQVAYRKSVWVSSCFATAGGGAGYVGYQSKNTIPEGEQFKLSAHSVGINGFIGLEYRFVRHWGVSLEVNALYSLLKPSKCNNEAVSLKQRGKFGLFVLATQIGITSHF